MKISRREFVKTSAVMIGTLTVGVLPATVLANVNVECPSCGSVNVDTDRKYCYSCGVNLSTCSKEISCCDKKNCKSNISCHKIPFPNHRYVRGSRKPDISLSMVRF